MAEEWKEDVSLATGCVHDGWNTAGVRSKEECGRKDLADRRATDRGAERAKDRRENML